MAGSNPLLCGRCGSPNIEGSRFCARCGQGLGVPDPEHPVSGVPSQPPPFSASGEPPQQPGVPPYQLSPSDPAANINNNLVWAILATICCCIPTGIVSIIYAAQVNGKLSAGDIIGARQYANNAKTWAIISLVLGLLSIVVSLAFGLAGVIESEQQWLEW